MSDFWSRKLGGNRPSPAPAAPAQAPQTSTARPWWDPRPPAPEPAPEPQEDPRFADAELARHRAKATSAKQHETCPDCGSANFMVPLNSQSRRRCLDCGYPLVQSGSGGAGLPSGTGGPATPAKQIHDGTSNYNPSEIIGRIQ